MTSFIEKVYASLLVTESYLPVIYSDQRGIPTVGLGCALVVSVCSHCAFFVTFCQKA